MTKTIKQLSKEIAEHLGIDPLPIKFKDLRDVKKAYHLLFPRVKGYT